MPAYKYTLKNGKTMWYAAFNYTDWTGKYRHTCKRGFKTQREAKEYERSVLDQQNATRDILFSSLVENYMEDKAYYYGQQAEYHRQQTAPLLFQAQSVRH